MDSVLQRLLPEMFFFFFFNEFLNYSMASQA